MKTYFLTQALANNTVPKVLANIRRAFITSALNTVSEKKITAYELETQAHALLRVAKEIRETI